MSAFARLAVLSLVAASAASSVLAQVPAPPPRPPVNMVTRYGASAAENQTRFAQRIIEAEHGREAVDEERATLIDRIAPLVAEGRCNEAREMARREGDRAVSRRIGQVCVEGRPTPIEPAPAT